MIKGGYFYNITMGNKRGCVNRTPNKVDFLGVLFMGVR